MKPYVSIDIETTGLSDQCQVLEIGAVIEDWTSPVECLPTFHCYIFADGNVIGEPFALSMHPTILRRIADREPGYTYAGPRQAKNLFLQWLIKEGVIKDEREAFIPAGKNFNGFDRQFLKRLPGWETVKMIHRCIDPAMLYWRPGEVPPGSQECKDRAGIPGNVAHTALEDAFDIVRLIRKRFDFMAPPHSDGAT